MGSSKKISVIVPVYNVEKYLRECLDSIVNQTLKDIEIICVNDGSTDGSLKILEEYASGDDRIVVINQKNQGQGIARNNGIDAAQGEYIAFVDSDDFIECNALETIYTKIEDTDIDIVQFDFTTCDENKNLNKNHSFYKKVKRNLNYELKKNSIFKWSDFSEKNFAGLRMFCWDKIYSTKFIKDHNIRFAESRFCEDQIFSISSYLLADKILYLNEHFYTYRVREGSLTHVPSSDISSAFNNIELLKNFLIRNGIFEVYQEVYREYIIKALRRQYVIVSEEKEEEFLQKCADLLSTEDYKRFIKETKPKLSFAQRIFSVTNKRVNGKKHKIVCILGFKKLFVV